MKGQIRESWHALCEQAAVEQDVDQLLELVRQINRLLDEKEQRLRASESHQSGSSKAARC